jgi:hypothetical protein
MGVCCLNIHSPNRDALSGLHLNDPMEAVSRQEWGRAMGRDVEMMLAQTPQRRQVNMIGMEMRKEHGVDMGQRNRLGGRAGKMADPRSEQWVSQKMKPFQLNQ